MDFTTAQLAERAGVSAGTLRVWQTRYDFPAPPGTSGRHRYGEADVRAVREVRRLRAEGVSMSAAIPRARAMTREIAPSIYAGLRERRPDLRPQVLNKRAILEVTRAIEDEHAAHAGGGLLIGSFQTVRHYRASEARWRELARPVAMAVALADFPRMRGKKKGPLQVPIGRDDPLAREWTLIVDSPGAQACLASWELPERHRRDGDRRFEFVWSFDPATVADATRVATALLGRLAPSIEIAGFASGELAPRQGSSFAADLAGRTIAYLGNGLQAGTGGV